MTDPDPHASGSSADPLLSPMKSRPGWSRLWRAAAYSWAGLRAAIRHEAAFRQELLLVVPGVAVALWLQPGRWQTLAMIGSLLLVLVAELLNSAIEAVADAVTLEQHPLIGRAKDLGSAAVMLCLLLAALTWLTALWP